MLLRIKRIKNGEKTLITIIKRYDNFARNNNSYKILLVFNSRSHMSGIYTHG